MRRLVAGWRESYGAGRCVLRLRGLAGIGWAAGRRRRGIVGHRPNGVRLGLARLELARLQFVAVELPDIAPEDNSELAGAAKSMADALSRLMGLVGNSQAMKRAAVRLVMKFAGETVGEEEVEEMVGGE